MIAIGFADALVILLTGIDPLTLSNKMQYAIHKCKRWLVKYGLSKAQQKIAADNVRSKISRSVKFSISSAFNSDVDALEGVSDKAIE